MLGSIRKNERGCLKTFWALLAFAAFTSTAAIGVDTASATGLYKTTGLAGDAQGIGTTIEGSLEADTSLALLTTDEKPTAETCTGSTLNAKVEKAGGEGSHPSGKVSTLTFSGCGHTTDVLAKGELEVRRIAGTTNGTVISKGMEFTYFSTGLGFSCLAKTEGGTVLGTLTGAPPGQEAVLDINGVIPTGMSCGGDRRLKGTYRIKNPTGLIVEEVAESGTELYKNTSPPNDPQGVGTTIEGSLQAGSSLALMTTDEKTLIDTCTGSKVAGEIEKPGGEGSHPSGKVSALEFTGCSHKTTVLAKGELEVKHIAGTTNGTVYSKKAEVTVLSTTFGVTCIAKTESGTSLGTLTGAKTSSEQPTLHINAAIPTGFLCGGDSRLKGSFTVTSPTGLVVEET